MKILSSHVSRYIGDNFNGKRSAMEIKLQEIYNLRKVDQVHGNALREFQGLSEVVVVSESRIQEISLKLGMANGTSCLWKFGITFCNSQ